MSLLRTMTIYLLAAAALTPLASDAQQSLPDVVKPPLSINAGSISFYDGFGRLQAGFTSSARTARTA